MVNQINQGLEQLTLTSTSVTLSPTPTGTQNEIPKLLCLWAAATATVTLPTIETVLPNFTTATNYNVGSQPLSITIKGLTGQVINVSCASTDKFFGGDTIVISSTGARATFTASLTDLTWYLQ